MIYFIINPISGGRRGIRVWQELEHYLQDEKIPYSYGISQYPKHTVELVHEAVSQQAQLLVILGGDGTIQEVVETIASAGYTIPLAVIPAGSGNDFARGLGVNYQPLRLIDGLLHDPFEEKIDIGLSDQGHFASMLGMGFDAYVVQCANRAPWKKWLRRFSYLIAVFQAIYKYHPGEYEIEIDGRKVRIHNAWFISVSNHPFMGGGMMINPQARVNDGELDLCIIHDLPRWKLLFFFPKVYKGTHTELTAYVSHLRGKLINIRSVEEQVFHLDGEVKHGKAVHIQCISNALTVVRPRSLAYAFHQHEEERVSMTLN